METSRVCAFSDGVFAIAGTLLVLNLRVPDARHGGLLLALWTQWPSYASFAVSFLVVGIIWVNHHAMFQQVAQTDRPLVFLNLLLLMFVSTIPFPTSLMAGYLRAGADSHVAAAVYSGNMLAMSLSFTAVWLWAVHDRRLLHHDIDPAQARSSLARFVGGITVYALALAVAFISAPLSLGFHFLVALFFILDPIARGRPRPITASRTIRAMEPA